MSSSSYILHFGGRHIPTWLMMVHILLFFIIMFAIVICILFVIMEICCPSDFTKRHCKSLYNSFVKDKQNNYNMAIATV